MYQNTPENELEKIVFPVTKHETSLCRKIVYNGQSKKKIVPQSGLRETVRDF